MDDARRSVVIVDDAVDVRGLVRMQLILSGRFAVVGEGRNGHEAIELCREHQPVIALLDISMPDMDGLEALPRIRQVSPATQVVLYTGFDQTELAGRARELGAAAFIEKSAAITGLPAQLEAVLEDRPIPVAADEPEPESPTDASTVLGEHLERFREVFEEAAIGMATMTLTGRIVRANRALAELVGCTSADLVGSPYIDVAPSGDAEPITSGLREAQVGSGGVVRFEHDALRLPGRRLLATAAPVRDARGRPLYLFLQCQDVTARRKAERQLRMSEQRFRLLVEAVQDYAIFMLDAAGHVISWNAGAQRIKGYHSREIIGRHFRVFYPPDIQASGHPEHELEIAIARGRYEEEGWRVRKDGTRFWASVVITAVHDDSGELIGFGKVTRDMTERRQMLLEARQSAAALAKANADLELANARLADEAADQARFLAVTAHELRNPIGVLAGSAKLLVTHLDKLTDEDRDGLADAVATSAARLQRLLRDLLTAARLEANAIPLELTDVDVETFVAHALATTMAATDADVRVDVTPGLKVRGEPERLAQALENLLTNAVRYGAQPITVTARAAGDHVEIAVSDVGPGVRPELQDRLFDRFASSNPGSGTGLGLFIVRELARAHGGDARYDSDADGHPRFVISLPAAPSRGSAPADDMP